MYIIIDIFSDLEGIIASGKKCEHPLGWKVIIPQVNLEPIPWCKDHFFLSLIGVLSKGCVRGGKINYIG